MNHDSTELSSKSPQVGQMSLGAKLWFVIKWVLFALVLWYVGRQIKEMWEKLGDTPIVIHWGWFTLSAVLTLVAWAPSVWYWRSLMRGLGCDVPWFPAIHSYYVGHLGKYVPGKATVIVIRTAILRVFGVGPAIGTFTVTLETLTYMSAGVTVAAALVPYAAADFPQLPLLRTIADSGFLRIAVPLGLAVTGVIALTIANEQFVKAALRGAAKRGETGVTIGRIPRRLPTVGYLVFLAAWWIQGLSLGAAIAAIDPVHAQFGDLPRWTGAAAISLVGGFLALFAPGGIGVREALLLTLLSQLEPGAAVLVSVLWRGASLAGELVLVPILHLVARQRNA